jgi:hypothetical protein
MFELKIKTWSAIWWVQRRWRLNQDTLDLLFLMGDKKRRSFLLSWIGFGRRWRGGRNDSYPERVRRHLLKQLHKPSRTTFLVAIKCRWGVVRISIPGWQGSSGDQMMSGGKSIGWVGINYPKQKWMVVCCEALIRHFWKSTSTGYCSGMGTGTVRT